MICKYKFKKNRGEGFTKKTLRAFKMMHASFFFEMYLIDLTGSTGMRIFEQLNGKRCYLGLIAFFDWKSV